MAFSSNNIVFYLILDYHYKSKYLLFIRNSKKSPHYEIGHVVDREIIIYLFENKKQKKANIEIEKKNDINFVV